jgi:hypothetical protein
MLIIERQKSLRDEVISGEMNKDIYRQISRTIITTPKTPPRMQMDMDPQRIAAVANHSPVPELDLNRDGISDGRIR